MQNTKISICFRHADGEAIPEPEAAWESPACLHFASLAELQIAAVRQGVAGLLFSDANALFPDGVARAAYFGADTEELVWELACEQSDEPENAETWPPGYELLAFLAFWRLALLELGAHLELAYAGKQ